MEIIGRDEYFKARLSCRSDLSIPKRIKERLTKDMKTQFKKSCFGVFYNMTDIKFQGQLYLHLLFKQDSALTGEKLVFHVNNCVTEFGPNEFTLVTGLHFGTKTVIPESSKFYKSVFGREPELKVIDIEKAFMDATEKGSNRPNEVGLKLALLWVLYGILLMKDNTSKKIDTQYIHLMDNLEAFNKFPWGRVAYDFLCADIRSSMGRTASLRRQKNKTEKENPSDPQLDLHGYSYAVQFWAYEVMPCVAKLCATQISGSSIPRMLRWTSDKFYRFDLLTQKCFPVLKGGDEVADRLKVLPKMTPSSSEMKMLYFKSLVAWENTFEASTSKTRKRSRGNLDSGSVDETLKRRSKKKRGSNKQQSKESPRPADGDLKSLKSRMINMERTMKVILANQEFIMGKMGWSNDKSGNDEEDETVEETDVEVDEGGATEDEGEGSDADGVETGQNEEEVEGTHIETAEKGKDEVGGDVTHVDDAETGQNEVGEEGTSVADTETDKNEIGEEGTEVDATETGERQVGGKGDSVSAAEPGKNGGQGTEGAPVVEERDVFEDVERAIDDLMSELEEVEETKKKDDKGKQKEQDHQSWQILQYQDVETTKTYDPSDYYSQDLSIEGEMRDMIDDPLFHGMAYDPLDIIWPDKAEDEFKQWYENNRGTKATIELSVENIPGADHEFFAKIWEKKGWLEKKNLDALFNLVILKAKKWPKLFKQSWTTVDQFFWVLMTDRVYNEWTKAKTAKKVWDWLTDGSKVVDYVAGRLPLHGHGLDWGDLERVFGVGGVNTNHWVLYEIRLKDEEIVVYDTMAGSGRRPNPKTLSVFRRMASIMSSIYTELLGNHPDASKKKGNKAWPVTICPNVPQQKDSDSCGILAVKVFECIVTDRSIEEIDPEKVGEYRKKYCFELFDKNNIIM